MVLFRYAVRCMPVQRGKRVGMHRSPDSKGDMRYLDEILCKRRKLTPFIKMI